MQLLSGGFRGAGAISFEAIETQEVLGEDHQAGFGVGAGRATAVYDGGDYPQLLRLVEEALGEVREGPRDDGLVVNMPTWFQIEASAWRPYFTAVDEYMGWQSQLGLFPHSLEFEVVGDGGGTIPCAPTDTGESGGSIPAWPKATRSARSASCPSSKARNAR